MRRLRRIRARARRRPARLLRPLRAPAPRPGVGRDRHLRGRDASRPCATRASSPRSSTRRSCGRSQGDMAIGHVRYSTTGGGSWENAQPVWRDDGREVALAHNGNLTNAVELYDELTRARDCSSAAPPTRRSSPRCSPPTTAKLIEDAVAEVMPRLRGRLLDRGDDQARRSSPSATRTGSGRSPSAASATASSSPRRAAPSTSSAPS